MDSPNGVLVRRCFRLLNAKAMGLTITLADITEEELRVMELIEAERQEQVSDEDNATRRASRNSCCANCHGGNSPHSHVIRRTGREGLSKWIANCPRSIQSTV